MSVIIIRVKCACDCGEKVKPGSTFKVGHDSKLRAKLEKKVGGLLNLKALVEKHG